MTREAGAGAAALAVSYRPATDDDLAFLARVYFSTRTEELAPTGWPDAVKTAFLTQQFEAQHSYYRSHYRDTEWLVIERAGSTARFFGGGFRAFTAFLGALRIGSLRFGVAARLFADFLAFGLVARFWAWTLLRVAGWLLAITSVANAGAASSWASSSSSAQP